MRKYILYDEPLCIENIVSISDTEQDMKSDYKMAKIFRKMIGREDMPQMALVDMSEEEIATVLGNKEKRKENV